MSFTNIPTSVSIGGFSHGLWFEYTRKVLAS